MLRFPTGLSEKLYDSNWIYAHSSITAVSSPFPSNTSIAFIFQFQHCIYKINDVIGIIINRKLSTTFFDSCCKVKIRMCVQVLQQGLPHRSLTLYTSCHSGPIQWQIQMGFLCCNSPIILYNSSRVRTYV